MAPAKGDPAPSRAESVLLRVLSDREFDQFLVSIKRGTRLLWCRKHGKPKTVFVRLAADEADLFYVDGKQESIKLLSINQVKFGQKTATFQKAQRPDKENFSFSIVYSNGQQTFDLICKDVDEAEMWFLTLRHLLSRQGQSGVPLRPRPGLGMGLGPRADPTASLDLASQRSVSDWSPDNSPFRDAEVNSQFLRQSHTWESISESRSTPDFQSNPIPSTSPLHSTLEDDRSDDDGSSAHGSTHSHQSHSTLSQLSNSTYSNQTNAHNHIYGYAHSHGTERHHQGLLGPQQAYTAGDLVTSASVQVPAPSGNSGVGSGLGSIFRTGSSRQGYGYGQGQGLVPSISDGGGSGHHFFNDTLSSTNGDDAALEGLGDLFCWGKGVRGALQILSGTPQVQVHPQGLGVAGVPGGVPGDDQDAVLPQRMESKVMLDVVGVSAGEAHALLLTRGGEVFAWGTEDGGRLGLGWRTDAKVPVLVDALASTPVEEVACSTHTSCAVTRHGELFVWGDGTRCPGLSEEDQAPGVLGAYQWVPRRVGGALGTHRVVQVSCGPFHAAAVTRTGQLFTFGEGTFGALGHGSLENVAIPKEVSTLGGMRVLRVACGVWHTAAVVDTVLPGDEYTRGGGTCRLFTWGDSDKGKLGLVAEKAKSAREGVVQKEGEGSVHPVLVPTQVLSLGEESICQVACGDNITVALAASGKVFTMGSSNHGQLGVPGATGKAPVQVKGALGKLKVQEIACGACHVVAITPTSGIYTWGCGTNGRLGLGDFQDRESPTLVEALKDRTAVRVTCGGAFTAVICQHKPEADSDTSACARCKQAFSYTRLRHSCYNCGLPFCHPCSSRKVMGAAMAPSTTRPYRVCESCLLKISKPPSSGPPTDPSLSASMPHNPFAGVVGAGGGAGAGGGGGSHQPLALSASLSQKPSLVRRMAKIHRWSKRATASVDAGEDKSSVSASLSDFNVRKSQSDNQWGLNAQPPARGVPISVLRSSVNFPSGAFFRGSQGGAESGAELLAQAPTLAGLALGQGLGPAMRQGSGSRSGSGSAGGAGGRGPGEAQFHSQTLLSSSVRSPLGGDLSSMSSGNSSSDFALPQAGPGSAVGLSPWTTTGSGAGGGAIGGVGIGIGTGVASGAAQWHTRGSVPELSGGASLAAGAMRRSHDVGDIPFRDGLLPSASLRDSHPQPLGSAHHPGDPNHSHNYSNSHSGSHSSSQNARLGPPSIQLQVQPQPSNLRDSTSHSVRDSGGSLGGGLFNKAISLSRAGATAAAAVGAKRSTSPMRRSNHSPLRRTAVGMGSLQPPGKDSLSRGLSVASDEMARARGDNDTRHLSHQVAHLKKEVQELKSQLEVARREKDAAAEMAQRDVTSALQLANEESLKAAGGREVAQVLAIQMKTLAQSLPEGSVRHVSLASKALDTYVLYSGPLLQASSLPSTLTELPATKEKGTDRGLGLGLGHQVGGGPPGASPRGGGGSRVHAVPAKGDGVGALGEAASGPWSDGEREKVAKGAVSGPISGTGASGGGGVPGGAAVGGLGGAGGKSRGGHGQGHGQGQGHGEGAQAHSIRLPGVLKESEVDDRFRTRRHYSKAGGASLKKAGAQESPKGSAVGAGTRTGGTQGNTPQGSHGNVAGSVVREIRRGGTGTGAGAAEARGVHTQGNTSQGAHGNVTGSVVREILRGGTGAAAAEAQGVHAQGSQGNGQAQGGSAGGDANQKEQPLTQALRNHGEVQGPEQGQGQGEGQAARQGQGQADGQLQVQGAALGSDGPSGGEGPREPTWASFEIAGTAGTQSDTAGTADTVALRPPDIGVTAGAGAGAVNPADGAATLDGAPDGKPPSGVPAEAAVSRAEEEGVLAGWGLRLISPSISPSPSHSTLEDIPVPGVPSGHKSQSTQEETPVPGAPSGHPASAAETLPEGSSEGLQAQGVVAASLLEPAKGNGPTATEILEENSLDIKNPTVPRQGIAEGALPTQGVPSRGETGIARPHFSVPLGRTNGVPAESVDREPQEATVWVQISPEKAPARPATGHTEGIHSYLEVVPEGHSQPVLPLCESPAKEGVPRPKRVGEHGSGSVGGRGGPVLERRLSKGLGSMGREEERERASSEAWLTPSQSFDSRGGEEGGEHGGGTDSASEGGGSRKGSATKAGRGADGPLSPFSAGLRTSGSSSTSGGFALKSPIKGPSPFRDMGPPSPNPIPSPGPSPGATGRSTASAAAPPDSSTAGVTAPADSATAGAAAPGDSSTADAVSLGPAPSVQSGSPGSTSKWSARHASGAPIPAVEDTPETQAAPGAPWPSAEAGLGREQQQGQKQGQEQDQREGPEQRQRQGQGQGKVHGQGHGGSLGSGRTSSSGSKREEGEWVETPETGVYVTLATLPPPAGGNELRRVRFSRKVFAEREAELWWAQNKARVAEMYNVKSTARKRDTT